MTRGDKILVVFLVTSSFFITNFSAKAKILISQIQISGVSTTDEFVELYNYSSSTAPLVGFNLKKQVLSGTQSNLVSNFNNLTLPPYSYLLVAHRDYTPVNGVAPDLGYSSASVSLASNNSLLLFDPFNVLADRVDWGTVSTTLGLPAPNPVDYKSLTRLPNDDSGNWQDTDDSGFDLVELDPLPHNSLSTARPSLVVTPTSTADTNDTTTTTPTSTVETSSTTTPITDLPTSTISTSASPATTSSTTNTDANQPSSTIDLWPFIKINEFLPNPESGDEWIELYNTATTSLNLTGGILCDSRTSTTCTIATPTSTINANSWLTIFLSSHRLNNTGDSILLKNPFGEVVDLASYSETTAPAKNQSLIRKIDGIDTDNNMNDWAITTLPTPDTKNVLVVPPLPPPSAPKGSTGGSYTPAPQSKSEPASTTIPNNIFVSTTIIINELYPNPPGSDASGEFVEIKNIGNNVVDIAGWKLITNKKSFTLTGSIAPSGLLVLPRTQTNLTLANTNQGEMILVTAANLLADKVVYQKAEEGLSYSRDNDGSWHWSATITRGSDNNFTAKDTVFIAWKIIAPKEASVNEEINFNAEDSADPRGGLLNFHWNFGDGSEATGEEVTHKFATSGTYLVTVSATSSQGTTGLKQLKTIIENSGISPPVESIIINEIFSNPAGLDNKEFIEIYNPSSSSVSLANWKITTKDKKFVVPEGTVIAPQNYLLFHRTATHLKLDNKEDKVALASPRGEIIDLVKLGAGEPGQSYAFFQKGWQWSQPTPGKPNTQQVLGEKIIANITADSKSPSLKKSATKKSFVSLAIAEARHSEPNTYVRISGTITVPPGVFGKNYFYITDGSAGIQIYSSLKNLPSLSSGDMVVINGIASPLNGLPRVKITKAGYLNRPGKNQPIFPVEKKWHEIEENDLGSLIKLQGEITDVKSTGIYIDDGQAEALVYLKKGTNIDKRQFHLGDTVEITGIIEESKSGWQLWPRNIDDIKVLAPASEGNDKNQPAESQKSSLYIVLGGGSLLLIAGLFIKSKFLS